jgi:hypothetical protein
MKKTLFLIFFAIVFLYSCEKNDINKNEEQNNLSANSIMLIDNLKETAIMICKITDSNDVIQEIHKYIKKSINYGLDEELRFKEILESNSSKILDEKIKRNSKLTAKLQNYCSSNLKSGSFINLKDFLLSNNIQIYWPYSENWDGIEKPVITFHPMKDVEENIGFRMIQTTDGTTEIDTVIVNDAYAQEHPVLIININSIDYDNLPYFSTGHFSKNGLTFIQKEQVSNLKSTLVNNWNDPSKTYEIQMGYIKCSYQWDAIWNGGPDFMTKWIGVNTTTLTADYSGELLLTSLTRSDVSNSRWIRCYQPTNNNWQPSENENFYIFYEDDINLDSKEISGKLTYDKYGIEFKFPISSSDEILRQSIWERGSYFNQTLGINDPNAQFFDGWRLFSNNNTWWTIPFVVR